MLHRNISDWTALEYKASLSLSSILMQRNLHVLKTWMIWGVIARVPLQGPLLSVQKFFKIGLFHQMVSNTLKKISFFTLSLKERRFNKDLMLLKRMKIKRKVPFTTSSWSSHRNLQRIKNTWISIINSRMEKLKQYLMQKSSLSTKIFTKLMIKSSTKWIRRKTFPQQIQA